MEEEVIREILAFYGIDPNLTDVQVQKLQKDMEDHISVLAAVRGLDIGRIYSAPPDTVAQYLSIVLKSLGFVPESNSE